eukprot:m.106299 g.106299  ORF g.106299 m.106299 type:complete len:292 (-) comp9176_c0_seq1:71-946(-)
MATCDARWLAVISIASGGTPAMFSTHRCFCSRTCLHDWSMSVVRPWSSVTFTGIRARRTSSCLAAATSVAKPKISFRASWPRVRQHFRSRIAVLQWKRYAATVRQGRLLTASNQSKDGTARVVVYRELGITNSFTLESSFSGADRGIYKGAHFGTDHLEEMGRKFVVALLQLANPSQLDPAALAVVEEDEDEELAAIPTLQTVARDQLWTPSPPPPSSRSANAARRAVAEEDVDELMLKTPSPPPGPPRSPRQRTGYVASPGSEAANESDADSSSSLSPLSAAAALVSALT